jgi:hypothetical protein
MIDYRRHEGYFVKRLVWICLGILSFAFGLTMVFFYPFKHPFIVEIGRAAAVIMPVLFLQPFCGIWMLYQVIRYEAKPLPYVILVAFVPFSYVWYYIERVRPRNRLARKAYS